MKKYEKPVLISFSLSGNEALCACTYDVVGSNADPSMKASLIHLLRDMGYPCPDNEVPSNLFALSEDCAEKVDIQNYCKFGPSSEMIFNS